jgi:hypothetical protein
MSLKLMLEIKKELFDMWEVRTITKFQEYNEAKGQNDYYIQLNREGRATNAENILILCDDEEDQIQTLQAIRDKFQEQDNVIIL